MKKKRQGFTLIELLAVIVILALLLMIAIPGVTKYITQSRKKTITTTIGNYIGALINQVNDMEYTFTGTNTIYAIPIECISLEKGGSNPFGEWMQASNNYWAYVLIQYDDETSSYTYGFTFKDSAGYGLYPTTSEKLKENGSQIQTDLDLKKPETGSYVNITDKENWNGFILDEDTILIVLDAAKEGEKGDGVNTCTLCTKGSNYEEEEEAEEDKTLYNIVKKSVVSGKSRQYAGKGYKNYVNNVYFYNDTKDNNVLFANYCWKIIRTTDTGGVKLIYNGLPDDGVCDNSGSATQIGTSKYNEYSTSVADVGYMNGSAYEYNYKGIGVSDSTALENNMTFNKDYKGYNAISYIKYADSVKYENGNYVLYNSDGSSVGSYSVYNSNSNFKGKYSCMSSGTTCTSVYYIRTASRNSNIWTPSYHYAYFYGILLSNGQLITDKVFVSSKSFKINNEGKYVLENPISYNRIDVYNADKMYFCLDLKSTTCDKIYYRTGYSYAYSNNTKLFTIKYSDSNVNLVFGKSFTYTDGSYKLKDTISIKNWQYSFDDLSNYHYSCLNDGNDCEMVYYAYNTNSSGIYYIELSNGVSGPNALANMLTANNTNQYNSVVKSIVDGWYEENMTDYTSMLEDTVYCANRDVTTLGGWSTTGNMSEHLKFYSFDNNDLSCDNESDRFTVSSSIGNGKLTYPVGMITASEAKRWGGRVSGTSYWTMSAFGYGEAAAHTYKVWDDGFVNFDRVTYTNGVRPVVSLKPNTLVVSGDGSSESPYIVE